MPAFYSEFDPKAAAWLRELIAQGHIADGVVDERDLWDVTPDDLRGFDQIHLCAGVGVWSYALRRAGWPDDRPVWTGSFPCQPFSSAGKGEGFADERHLWPAGQWLIEQCGPAVVFGEQVASKDAEPWLDLVQADLEALAYAVGAVPFPSAGVGAPHIRDRLYWVADAEGERGRAGLRNHGSTGRGLTVAGNGSAVLGMADANDARSQGRRLSAERTGERAAWSSGLAGRLVDANGCGAREVAGDHREVGAEALSRARPDDRSSLPLRAGATSDMADAASSGRGEERSDARGLDVGDRSERLAAGSGASRSGPGPTNGLWRDADWLFCRDGKWRPVEPGTFPLAHGAPARVGRLRGYGNAINAEAAVAWIQAYLDAEADAQRVRLNQGVFA